MKRLVTLGVTVALFAVPAAGMAVGSSAFATQEAASPVAKVTSLATHSTSVRLAGTVNAASIHAAAPVRRPAIKLPLRRAPQSSATGGSAVRGDAPATSPLLTITPGTPLAGALGDQDNVNQNGFALTPPDHGLAVGNGFEVQFINDVGRIWQGPTSVSGPFALSAFFTSRPATDFISDPWLLFDTVSNRFYGGIFDVTLGGEIMAISQTNNPTGVWNLYNVRYPSTTVIKGGCPDQGKGGVDDNVIGLGFNEFSAQQCSGGGGSFLGAALEVFNKADAMSGLTLHFVFTDPLSTYFSLVPAQSLGATTTLYFSSTDDLAGTAFHTVTSTGVPNVSTVTLTALADIVVPKYKEPPGAQQSGTSTLIDSGDNRTQHVVWRDKVLVSTQTVGCTPANDTALRACARVTEVNADPSLTTVSLLKALTVSKLSMYYIYPAASLTSADNVVLTFSRSSSTSFASLVTTAAPLATKFPGVKVVTAGTATNVSGRFGDYNAIAIDPSGNQTNYWVAGEIGGTSGPTGFKWNTAVDSVTLA
jgi:hypothetical protein